MVNLFFVVRIPFKQKQEQTVHQLHPPFRGSGKRILCPAANRSTMKVHI